MLTGTHVDVKLIPCAVYRKPGLTPGVGQNKVTCDYNSPPGEGKVCDVNIDDWNPCTSANHYNYHRSAPCIFLKLNKVSVHQNQCCCWCSLRTFSDSRSSRGNQTSTTTLRIYLTICQKTSKITSSLYRRDLTRR